MDSGDVLSTDTGCLLGCREFSALNENKHHMRILVYENTHVQTSRFLLGRSASVCLEVEKAVRELTKVAMQKPQTVAEHIAGILREAIVEGSLQAGTPLRQDELAARFGFSRMPIRDALRQLENEGLVSIHPTRGAFVAKMDATEIDEIYAIRALLEAEALRLAFPNLTDEQMDKAASILDQLDIEADVGRWGALNRAFHLALYRPCGNGRLLDLIEAQHNAADRYVRILLSNLDYRVQSQLEHRELLAACRSRDEKKGLMWLTKHLRDGSGTLVKAIK